MNMILQYLLIIRNNHKLFCQYHKNVKMSFIKFLKHTRTTGLPNDVSLSVQNEEADARAQLHKNHSESHFRRVEISKEDCWSSRYYYIVVCCSSSINNTFFPLTLQVALSLSGGGYLIFLPLYSFLIGLPLIYMESFLGRYSRLTNCQMYHMAPIFFGISCVILLLNINHQANYVTMESFVLVNLLKLLANPNIYDECLEDSEECYDYMKKGKLNDTCTSGHISMICEGKGVIRYIMQFHYWRIYKDPSTSKFPQYQLITAVVLSWLLILTLLMKQLEALGKVIYVAFLLHISTMTMIFILALLEDGSINGLHMMIYLKLEEIDVTNILLLLWVSIVRLGLILPTGFMTTSAYANFKSNIGTECFLIVIIGLIINIYYMSIYMSVCGVLANAIGVDVPTVYVPERGLYLVVVPQFLLQQRMPNTFIILYYGVVWYFEISKIAYYIHMIVLNIYGFFPNLKSFSAYIKSTTCLVLCFMSMLGANKFYSVFYHPAWVILYIAIVQGVFTTVQTSMVTLFYGVRRLCDDVHFMTGQKPMQFWVVMWYVIPFLGGAAMISQQDLLLHMDHFRLVTNDTAWLYAHVVFGGYVTFSIFCSVMFILIRLGTPNLLLSLIKPSYFWGPPDKESRIDRKNFNPRSCTRVKQMIIKYGPGIDVPSSYQERILLSDLSKDILGDRAEKGDIMKDKLFFEHVGLHCQLTYASDNGQEADGSVAN